MTRSQLPAHFRSASALTRHISASKLGVIDARQWQEEWADRWVVFADLIAFAGRALRSDTVVLNNIVRFDRASHLAAQQCCETDVRRFSDSTFGIAPSLHAALKFAVALSHACLAFNREYLERETKNFFIHLIVPRMTIAFGRVLLVRDPDGTDSRFAGISPRGVLAGSAIVQAYQLEKRSAGGLVTLPVEAIPQISDLTIRGDNSRVRNGLRVWTKRLRQSELRQAGEVFCCRGPVLDIPWLLLRPIQEDAGVLWTASATDADESIRAFLRIWRASEREFYSPQNIDAPLDVAKHLQAATRHAVQVHQITRGRIRPVYQSPDALV